MPHTDLTENRAEYDEIGTVRVASVLAPDQIAELTRLLDDAIAALRAGTFPKAASPHPVFRDIEFEDHDGYVRLVNLMHRIPEIQEIVLNSDLPRVVADIIGAKHLRIWLDATFSKVGLAAETATPWHNDECTFSLQGEHLPSLWIGLTDVDEDNAPLITLAGSHRDQHRYYSTFFPQDGELPPNYRPWSELLERVEDPKADIRVWTVNAGDVLIIHPKTIHASLPRRGAAEGRRLAFTIRWIGSDVVYDPNEITKTMAPFDSDPRMVVGEPPPEALFPIVWRNDG